MSNTSSSENLDFDQEEPSDDEMEIEEFVDETQRIIDQLIQGHRHLGQILQENDVNDVIEDVATVVFQNVEADRLFIIRAQLDELDDVNDVIEDFATVVFQNVEADRLFIIRAQLDELFPEDNPEDPPANQNPGDSIFGLSFIQRLVTRLSRQLEDEEENDDLGAPPMEPEDIANIPTTMVEEEMLDRCSSCPICLEALQLREEVNILRCGHFFHAYCIRTWLGMHATCPVCRRVEERDGDWKGGEGVGEEY